MGGVGVLRWSCWRGFAALGGRTGLGWLHARTGRERAGDGVGAVALDRGEQGVAAAVEAGAGPLATIGQVTRDLAGATVAADAQQAARVVAVLGHHDAAPGGDGDVVGAVELLDRLGGVTGDDGAELVAGLEDLLEGQRLGGEVVLRGARVVHGALDQRDGDLGQRRRCGTWPPACRQRQWRPGPPGRPRRPDGCVDRTRPSGRRPVIRRWAQASIAARSSASRACLTSVRVRPIRMP